MDKFYDAASYKSESLIEAESVDALSQIEEKVVEEHQNDQDQEQNQEDIIINKNA